MAANNTLGEMPFREHLSELRNRLIKVVGGVFVATLLAYNWAAECFAFVIAPLRWYIAQANTAAATTGVAQRIELIGTGPTEAFVVKLKVAIAFGVLLSSPWSFYQLWRFIAPGLHEHERRYALPFVFASTALFLIGSAFCFYGVFPFAFEFFFDEFASIGVTPSIRIGEYLGFTIKLVLVFGLIFELPLASFFLTRFRLLTHTWLLRNFRYAVVVIFIVAGILTPPDVVTQLFLAGPLLVIYAVCIGIAYYFAPKPRAE